MNKPLCHVLVPIHRSADWENVLKNFSQQKWRNRILIAIVNGDAKNDNMHQCFRVLKSGNHAGLARNVGLQYAREYGSEFIAFFDSDDYYSPNYLTECYEGMLKSKIVGKRCHFVYDKNQGLHLFNERYQNSFSETVLAGTIAGDPSYMPNFPISGIGEERKFCDSAPLIWATSKYNFCWMRHDNNTFKANFDDIAACWGPSKKVSNTFDKGLIDG